MISPAYVVFMFQAISYSLSNIIGTMLFQLAFLLVVSLTQVMSAYYASCEEDAGRQCQYLDNRTDYLLNLKKGGTDVLSTETYLYDFVLCEDYNYDCGYMPSSDSYLTIADGVQLNFNATVLAAITTSTTTYNKILPYLGLQGESVVCASRIFPLELAPAESIEVLDGYMEELQSTVMQSYDTCRNSSQTLAWADININIRTALLSRLKDNFSLLGDTTFWYKVCINDFAAISEEIKLNMTDKVHTLELHEAYLIDSVTQECNKYQSINFLVDESGSIGLPGFQLALYFLQLYVNTTKDDFSLMSIHFFATNFAEYITYDHDYTYIYNMIKAKGYANASTNTGRALNATIQRIVSKGFPTGVPKIIAILTDGNSQEEVVSAAEYARVNGITILAIGITSGINMTQLLQMAGNPSNIILVNSYSELPKLVDFISNYFCKQITTIQLDQVIEGNYVRVPESPSFFRVPKSETDEQYELDIYFEEDPVEHNQSVAESQFDPFPDEFSEYTASESYEIFWQPPTGVSSSVPGVASSTPKVGSTFVPMKVYFIQPKNNATITQKKDITITTEATVSYVAVRGNNLGFNITLKKCATAQCTDEKEYYKSQQAQSQSFDVFNPTDDLSIFIGIGATLGALACCCGLCCFGIRRCKNDENKQKPLTENTSEQNKTDELFDENLIPAQTKSSLRSQSQKRSQKSKQDRKEQQSSKKGSAKSSASDRHSQQSSLDGDPSSKLS